MDAADPKQWRFFVRLLWLLAALWLIGTMVGIGRTFL
jgi:hypothetical protein